MEKSFNSSTTSAEQSELLKVLLAHHVVAQATDLHILSDNSVWCRQRGLMNEAKSWSGLTDAKGKLQEPHTFISIKETLFGEKPIGFNSRVFRSKNYQVRVQPVDSINGRKLIFRIQRHDPPLLETIFKDFPKTRELLANASGLVLFCGAIGAGKTTTAASLCAYLASRRSKHIASIEDPVEYVHQSDTLRMTHIQAVFPGDENPGEPRVEGIMTLRESLRVLRRANIDGLFVGEVRDTETRDECLDFAATKEALITTIHAGGLADAVLRFTRPVQGGVDQATLRLALAQCLHAIVYVNLAFNDKGEPQPVFLVLPGQEASVRSAIADLNPKTLGTQLNAALQSCSIDKGAINVNNSARAAKRAGATEDSIKAAFPADMMEGLALFAD